MAVRIQFRRGNAAQWTASNPTLRAGEMGIELDTHLFKIGNGTLDWNSLDYGGLIGPTGPQGISITMKGTVPTTADLPTGAAVNDAWIVTADENLWVWNGTTWVDAGQIIGPQGEIGPTGPTGPMPTSVDGGTPYTVF